MFKRKVSREPRIGETCRLNHEIRSKLLKEGNGRISKYLMDQSQIAGDITKKTAFIEHIGYLKVVGVSHFNKNLLIVRASSSSSLRTTWIDNRVARTLKKFTVSKKCLVLHSST